MKANLRIVFFPLVFDDFIIYFLSELEIILLRWHLVEAMAS